MKRIKSLRQIYFKRNFFFGELCKKRRRYAILENLNLSMQIQFGEKWGLRGVENGVSWAGFGRSDALLTAVSLFAIFAYKF
jgi:hypothetical protein